jgi:hypothetical protein
MRRNLHILALAAGALLAGCRAEQPTAVTDGGTAPKAIEAPAIRDETSSDCRRRLPELPPPEAFVTAIDNPWLAFEPGKVFRYESETEDGLETIVVEVTAQTKVILGVTTTVVHDRAYLDGELIENTFDWFAQDEDGNVWYFGEATEEIDHGQVVSTEGSWEAGVAGATPGILMLARPKVGVEYAQENAEGVAEDRARVVDLDARIRVPYGRFSDCLQTLEWTPLEPGAREFKFYARGVGLVLESQRRDGRGGRVELIAIEP